MRLSVMKKRGQAWTAAQDAGKPDNDGDKAYERDDDLAKFEDIAVNGNSKPALDHPEDYVSDE